MGDLSAAPEFTVVMSTVGSEDAAARLAHGAVEQGLAACVQSSPIASVYRWEGDVQQDREVLLLFKTASDRVAALRDFIQEQHEYDVPEILELPVSGGSADYLGWVHASTRR